MIVRSVIPTESSKIGLSDGDRLLAVNQITVTKKEDVRDALRYERYGNDSLIFETNEDGKTPREIKMIWKELSEHPRFEIDENRKILDGPEGTENLFGSLALSMNGRPFENNEELQQVTERYATRSAAMKVQNSDGNQTIMLYTVENWTARSMTLLSGILVGVTALTVSWLRGGSIGAWGFVFFGLNLGVFSISRSIPFDYRLPIEMGTYFVAQVSLMATGAMFLVSFASLRLLAEQKLSKAAVLCMTALGLVASFVVTRETLSYMAISQREQAGWIFLATMIPSFLLASVLLFPKHLRVSTTRGVIYYGIAVAVSLSLTSAYFFHGATSTGILGMPLFFGWLVYNLALISFCIGSNLILRLISIPIPTLDRRRSKILVVSMVCSFLPVAIYHLLRVTILQNLTSIGPFMEFAQVLFPLAIAYGIVKQNILQLSRFFLEAVAYIFLLTTGFIGYVFVGTFLQLINSQSGQSVIGSAFFMTVMAALLLVLHTIASKRFTLLGQYTPEAEEEFIDALHDLTVDANSVNEIYEFLDRELQDTLQITATDLLIDIEKLETQENPNRNKSPRLRDLNGLENGDAILTIASNEGLFFVRDLEEQIDSNTIQTTALEVLHGLSSDLVIPVRSHNELIGSLSLGPKVGDKNFTKNELDFLNRLCRRLGASLTAISNREHHAPPRRIIDVFPRYPQLFEEYKIRGVLGQGGMSYVYLGEKNGQLAAIKVGNHRVQLNSMLRSRFNREWEILAGIRHPRIVGLLHHGQSDTEPFMAFEFMKNGSMADSLRRNGPLEGNNLTQLLRDVIEGLDHALRNGVIHRDLKPHNLYLDEHNSAKISDFGAARIEDDDQFTMSGEIIGTLAYMAPERLEGRENDWRADQYSLGVTAYELLTGSKPFAGRTLEAQLVSKLNWTMANTGQLTPYADRAVCEAISRMLLPDASHRFNSYGDLLKSLA